MAKQENLEKLIKYCINKKSLVPPEEYSSLVKMLDNIVRLPASERNRNYYKEILKIYKEAQKCKKCANHIDYFVKEIIKLAEIVITDENARKAIIKARENVFD
ncbi:MAG: hypothetical protein ABIH65_00925 [Nanoarchaeota archaeon]